MAQQLKRYEVYGNLRFDAKTLAEARTKLDELKRDCAKWGDVSAELRMDGVDVCEATIDLEGNDGGPLPVTSSAMFEDSSVKGEQAG